MASSSTPQQGPPHDGHKSRRDNQSVASTHSIASSSSSRTARPAHPAVESAVTRLLVAIKQLLESLTMWSNLQLTETQISDVYVRLGNDFNAAVAAFAAFDIDMADLMSIPEDLRDVLETCLAEDATPDNLAIYLPKVRAIITRLLQGLRSKQSLYRRIISEQQNPSSRHRSGSAHSRTNSRSSKSDKAARQDDEARQRRSQLSRSRGADEERHVERERESVYASRHSARPSHSSKPSETQTQLQPNMTPPPVFQEPDDDPPANDRTGAGHVNGYFSQVSQPPSRNSQQAHPPSYPPQEQHTPAEPAVPTLPNPRVSYPPTPEADRELPQAPGPPIQSAPVPPSVKRYSLVDKPVSPPPASPPTVIIEEPSPDRNDTNGVDSSPPRSPPIEVSDTPAVASSLAALKKSDALERRASKRFSTYHFSKMTGGVITRERSLPTSPNRRSMAASSMLTPGDLAVLTEVDEPEGKCDGSAKRTLRAPSPAGVEFAPPVPPLPPSVTDPARSPALPRSQSHLSRVAEEVEPEESPQSSAFPVFLQVGREVKKVTLESGLTFAFLRMLFVDKFSYNPGMENFPTIYIRDPSSGVQYELEDIDEVKEKCLLSLNIEPLDQIKQHIDAQISTLTNDLKELKSAMVANKRSSVHVNPIVAHDFAESTPPVADRPSEKQFAHVARRLSRIVGDAHNHSNPFIFPQTTGQSLQLQPQATGASVMSEYSNRVVDDLKTQFDEVQNLRRDLGIMRQLYTEFMKSTKDSLGALRTQTQSVKQLANAKVGGARAYIDTGKTKLDSRSQNVLTKIEELQDTVEALKGDVIKRQVTPKPQLLKTIQDDVASTAAELASLKEHIDTIKPMWKKTWEEELQNIVEEQGFLGHQEELLADLLEDYKALNEVFGHVQKVISLRGPGRGSARGRAFKPLPVDEGHTGLSTVMMEIRGASVDPEKRMKAIVANQRHREKELANRSDVFQNELTGFVSGKKLKMTGGAEEAERVRQKRNDLALKAMFNVSAGVAGGTGGGPSGEVSLVSPTA